MQSKIYLIRYIQIWSTLNSLIDTSHLNTPNSFRMVDSVEEDQPSLWIKRLILR